MTQAKGNKPQNKQVDTAKVEKTAHTPRPALPPLDLNADDDEIIKNLSARVYGSKRSGYNHKVLALIQGFVPVIVVANDFSASAPVDYFEKNLSLDKLRGILSGSDANFTNVTANRLSGIRRYLSSLQGYTPSAPLSEQTIGHHRLICSRLLSILHHSLPGERGRKTGAGRHERKPNRGNRRPFQKKEIAGTPASFQVRPPRTIERIAHFEIVKVETPPENGSKLPGAVYNVIDRKDDNKVVLSGAKLKEARLFADPSYFS